MVASIVINRTPVPLGKLLQELGAVFKGSIGETEGVSIHGVASPAQASGQELVFITAPEHLAEGFASKAKVLCVPESVREKVAGHGDKIFLFSPQPERAMRETILRFFLPTPYTNQDFEPAIHATAVVHPEAKLARGVRVGPYSVIAKGVTIDEDSTIGAHCVVETGTTIGKRTVLHPFVAIGHSTVIGNECEIHSHSVVGKEGFGYVHDAKFNHYRIPHLGRVILGDRVHLGASNTIDRGKLDNTVIGSGSIFDNRVHIAHGCTIGENAVITAGFVVAGSTKIGRNFLTGGNTSINGHIEICDNVQLGAISAVRKSITTPGSYTGNPLLPLREASRMMVGLTKLPEILRAMKLKSLKNSAE